MAKLVLRNFIEGRKPGSCPSLFALAGTLGDALSNQEGFSEGLVVLLGVSGLFWVMQTGLDQL